MPEKDEIEDPVELMLQKTGCIELHHKVQECIAETGDWRSCQHVVKEFKQCMQKYTEEQTRRYAPVQSENPNPATKK